MSIIPKLAKTALAACLLMTATAATAQEHRGFWDKKVGKFIRKVDTKILELSKSKVDTNYIGSPKYAHTLFLQGRQFNQLYDIHVPANGLETHLPPSWNDVFPTNWPDLMFADAKIRSHKTSIQLGLNCGNLTLTLPLPIINAFNKDYGISSNGSTMGFTVRYRVLKNAGGTMTNGILQMAETTYYRLTDWIQKMEETGDWNVEIDRSPVTPQIKKISNGDMSLHTFYADAYYVFNHKRFSLAAGRTGQAIQRRRAGSFIAMANFNQSQLRMYDLMNAEQDYFRHREFSIGLGYAYNLPLKGGKICLHASVIPMFSLINQVKHKAYNIGSSETDAETADSIDVWEDFDKNFYNSIDNHKNSRFTINGFIRLGGTYNLGRIVLSANCEYRRYVFNNKEHFRIKNRQLDFTVRCGWRF